HAGRGDATLRGERGSALPELQDVGAEQGHPRYARRLAEAGFGHMEPTADSPRVAMANRADQAFALLVPERPERAERADLVGREVGPAGIGEALEDVDERVV